jgi:polar amino acid transport system substrate-binding protein
MLNYATNRLGRVARLSALAFGAALLLGVAAPTQAATLAEIKERGYMVVATEDNYKPFEYMENGEPKGLDHDLIELLRDYAPFEIRQQIIPWQGLLAGVETGKYDAAITAAVITEDRFENLDFAMPISEATHYYVKRAGDESIQSVADLSGKVVGVQSGGASYAALPHLESLLKEKGGELGKVVQYSSFPEAYQDLATGRLDYVVNGVINLLSLTSEHPDRFEMGQRVSAPSYAAWAVAKGNASVWAFLNGFLADVRESGKLYELQEKWLGRSFESMPLYWEP